MLTAPPLGTYSHRRPFETPRGRCPKPRVTRRPAGTDVRMNDRYPPTYLNDHLAGAAAGADLAQRAASSNADNEYGEFLEELSREIADDKASLEMLMDRLGVKKDPIKTTAARLAERVGRLKPNAH